uniref:CEMIP beta-helix domain-containing protein n=3 Tax=Spongospora subterranea TaxID=70186 RepID=A0A0H5QV67_9EUKA|eukprot:CRZ05883.1 hypothetical protein [Spongospora subterranea]
MGRYPFHIHMAGLNGRNSFLKSSSIHHSFYRCISVHGSYNALVSENVAYSIVGHCYYIEDGVEENNVFEYNLGALVHPLGGIFGQDKFWSQGLDWINANPSTLLIPTDATASVFYITNAMNEFRGNAASGGWSGFAFPALPKPILLHQNVDLVPSSRPLKVFEGNSAHSTGFWWTNAGAIYVGGLFEHDANNGGVLHYNAGRQVMGSESCLVKPESWGCPSLAWMRFNNTKVFLANRGIMHWGRRAEVVKLEAYDCGKAANMFGMVWVNQMLATCRSGNFPTFANGCSSSNWWECAPRDYLYWQSYMGFEWYDVGQQHIVTNTTFRNCHNKWSGCLGGVCSSASPWGLLTHSDQFVPEIMQATTAIRYENCDQTNLWRLETRTSNTVSGRLQNWVDIDGSASQRRVPTMMGSTWANDWWKTNDQCSRAPLDMDMWLCDLEPVASITVEADPSQTGLVGNTQCSNGYGLPCPPIAYVNHLDRGPLRGSGLNVTVNSKITGPITSGWYLRYLAGAPKTLSISNVQIMDAGGHQGPILILALPYPPQTTFTVTAAAASWCYPSQSQICTQQFSKVNSLAQLRQRTDAYFFDSAINVLYVAIIEQHEDRLGNAGVWDPWQKPKSSFTRQGISLISPSQFYKLTIVASCQTHQGTQFCPMDNSDFDVVRTALVPAQTASSTSPSTLQTASSSPPSSSTSPTPSSSSPSSSLSPTPSPSASSSTPSASPTSSPSTAPSSSASTLSSARSSTISGATPSSPFKTTIKGASGSTGQPGTPSSSPSSSSRSTSAPTVITNAPSSPSTSPSAPTSLSMTTSSSSVPRTSSPPTVGKVLVANTVTSTIGSFFRKPTTLRKTTGMMVLTAAAVLESSNSAITTTTGGAMGAAVVVVTAAGTAVFCLKRRRDRLIKLGSFRRQIRNSLDKGVVQGEVILART